LVEIKDAERKLIDGRGLDLMDAMSTAGGAGWIDGR
jgi:hypothetical protein